MSENKNTVSMDGSDAAAPSPSESSSGAMAVELMVAGLFLAGLVALVAVAILAYSLGLPMVVIAVLAVVLLGGVFAALRRWSES
jgi:fatty acid desaturase